MWSRMFQKGEKGFTLIELLIVVAILGTIAAIVVPNILNVKDEGRVDAANTEHYNAQLAILSAMVDQEIVMVTPGLVGPDDADISEATGNADTIVEIDVPSYISGVLQAIYTCDEDGHITNATTIGLTHSKWEGLNFSQGAGWSD